jgi:excisionase family DNA binding protein
MGEFGGPPSDTHGGQLTLPSIAKNLHRDRPSKWATASDMIKNDHPLTVEEAATILRLSSKTIRSYCAAREIRASKVGGIWFIHRAAFERQFGQYEPNPNRKGA